MDPGFSGTKFFWVQVFQCPDFSGSESSFQILCLGPGFTNSYIYFFLQQHFSLFFHFRDQRCLFLFEWCLIYTQNFKRNNYIMYGFWGISEIGKTWKSKSWSVKIIKEYWSLSSQLYEIIIIISSKELNTELYVNKWVILKCDLRVACLSNANPAMCELRNTS